MMSRIIPRLRRWVMALALIAAGACLTACKSRAAQLEQQLAIAERALASPTELCRLKREVARAYLEAGNEREYQLKNLVAEAYCLDLEERRLNSAR